MGLSRQQAVMVFILLSGGFIAVLNQTLLSPAFPVIMRDLAIDATTVQWLASGYSLTEAVIYPISAYFAGRFTNRKLFIGAEILFVIGTLLAAFAPAFPFILAGRMIQAGATGAAWSMIMSVILLTFPRERRGSAMGLVGLVCGFAPAVGPTISGVLVQTIGWRALFVLVAILMTIIIIVAAFVLKNIEAFEPATFDKLSVFLVAAGLVSLLYGLSSISSGDQLILCIVLIGVGAVLLGLFAWRQVKLPSPLLRIEVLKSRDYRVAVLLCSGYLALVIGTGVILPIYIQNILGYTPLETGLVIMPGALGGAFVGLAAGRLFDRYGVRLIALPGLIVAFIGTIGMAFFGLDTTLLWIAILYSAMCLGLQAMNTPLNTWGINSLDNSMIQHANAVTNTVNQVCVSLVTAVLVTLASTSTVFFGNLPELESQMAGYHISFIAVAVIVGVMLLTGLCYVRDRKQKVTGEAALVMEEVPEEPGEVYNVGRAMNTDPYFVSATATVREVIKLLTDKGTSGVPVVDEDFKVIGFISDGDIMGYIARQDASMFDYSNLLFQYNDREKFIDRIKELMGLTVMQIATTDVSTVESSVAIEDVARIFSEKGMKKLPVVEQGRLVGSISRSDIIRHTMTTMEVVSAEAS